MNKYCELDCHFQNYIKLNLLLNIKCDEFDWPFQAKKLLFNTLLLCIQFLNTYYTIIIHSIYKITDKL